MSIVQVHTFCLNFKNSTSIKFLKFLCVIKRNETIDYNYVYLKTKEKIQPRMKSDHDQ